MFRPRGQKRVAKIEKCGRKCGEFQRKRCEPGAEIGRAAKTKRPSVETEGRLTIACHMKKRRKIDVGLLVSRTKIKTEQTTE
jgi:hypothetical protein